MNVADLRTLYAYNAWATTRIFDAARLVSAADFTRDLATSHASLRSTLVHLVWGEWVWLRRWLGESPKRVFDPESFPDVDTIAARAREVDTERTAFLAGLDDAVLTAPLSYENVQGERWTYSLGHMLQHVANHSTYHRGQAVTLLRQLGQAPPATDFLLFFDEFGEQVAGIALKRVYDAPSREDGCRILVERLWPRGLSKRAARVDYWAKDAAPSAALRRWFAHDAERWPEFKRRYARELRARPEALAAVLERLRAGKVTFVFAARETRFNNAVALKGHLERNRS